MHMKTKYTQAAAKRLHKQRDALARCCMFAVNHFKLPFGSGTVMRRDASGNFSETEHWLTWFRRELKEVGIEWDDELLEYGRASNTNRKRMLKESPTLAAKLEANRKAREKK